MKRYIALALALLMLFTLIGCNKKNKNTTDAPTSSGEPAVSVTPSETESAQPTPTPLPSPTPIEQTLHFQPEVAAGENGTIVVSINLSGNKEFAGYGISLLFDAEKLEVADQSYKVPNGYTATNLTTPGRVLLQCTVAGGNGITLNGVINTVTFNLKEGAEAKDLHFEIAVVDDKDVVYTYDTVTHTTSDVEVTFGKTDYSAA